MSLLNQRCFNHFNREAAARCPSCRRYYCRECVIEHEGRMMCASCVARLQIPQAGRSSNGVLWSMFSVVGVLMAWAIFYYLGMGLARIPSTFHGGLR
jgi:hypothetical protein